MKIDAKEIFWNKTPEEQELKVGDWISMDGHQRTYIGASAKVENGKIVGLDWVVPKDHSNTRFGEVDICSQSSGEPLQTDRIKAIFGLVNKNTVGSIPLNNNDLVNINNAIAKWHDVRLPFRPQVRVTAQISRINQESDHWVLYCLQNGAYVEFLTEK